MRHTCLTSLAAFEMSPNLLLGEVPLILLSHLWPNGWSGVLWVLLGYSAQGVEAKNHLQCQEFTFVQHGQCSLVHWARLPFLCFAPTHPCQNIWVMCPNFMSPSNLPCAYHLSKEATQGIICFLHLAASTSNLGDVSGLEQIRRLEDFLVRDSVFLCSCQERLHVLHQKESGSLQEVS